MSRSTLRRELATYDGKNLRKEPSDSRDVVISLVFVYITELNKYHPALHENSRVILHQANVHAKTKIRDARGKGFISISPGVYGLLPKKNPLPESKTLRSCAVIGNSGSLLKSECGKEIDSNDFVIRCNLGQTGSFKQDAGTRSNLTTMNPSILHREYMHLKRKREKRKLKEALSHYQGVIFVPSMSKRFYMATLAVQMCQEVTLFGFWPFPYRFLDNQKVPVRYHYFDNMSNAVAMKHHAMDDEFSILLQLHNLGILRIRHDRCE
ncbi:alpha-2,8-sialyltransferase 8B-like [Diadema antillarum]|uniref:alpha-2,8-sialyltransferase 8B-like n=1 Tax=Diadema antillarum TaxID=105358 RepID=UPI003A882D4E